MPLSAGLAIGNGEGLSQRGRRKLGPAGLYRPAEAAPPVWGILRSHVGRGRPSRCGGPPAGARFGEHLCSGWESANGKVVFSGGAPAGEGGRQRAQNSSGLERGGRPC